MNSGFYEVLYPLGRASHQESAETELLAPRLTSLEGKTICELWNRLFHGNMTFPMIEELLAKRYPGVKFVPYTKFGYTHGADEDQVVADLPRKLQEYGCDAVISGNGC